MKLQARWWLDAGRIGAVLVLALLLAWPRAASAHGGKLAVRATSGPYHVESVVSRAGGSIDETITVTDATTHRPVTGVVVLSLTDDAGQTLGPFVARPLAGLYEVRYPAPPSSSQWNVVISVTGPAGQAEVRHPYVSPGSGWTGLILTAIGAIVLIAAPFVAYRYWFRAPAEAPPPAAGQGAPGV